MTLPRRLSQPSADDSHLLISGWRYRAVTYSVILAAIAYLVFAAWGGWRDVVEAVGMVGLAGLLAALSLSLVNYGLRFLRWQSYLGAMGHPVPWRPSLRIYLSGFALTTTPGKAGETLRGILLRQRGVPYPVSFAAFISERFSDLMAVVLLALAGLSMYPAARPVVFAAAALAAAGLLALSSGLVSRLLAARATGPSRASRFVRHLLDMLLEARECHRPSTLSLATLLSVIAWAAEAWAFHLLLHWMNVPASLQFSIFVYSVSMLTGALSLMPGGLGGAEAAMVSLLLWHDVSAADAVAATVLIRLTTLWFAVAIGLWQLLTSSTGLSVSSSEPRP